MKQTAKKKNLFRISAVLALMAAWAIIPFILNDGKVSADIMSWVVRIEASMSGAPIGGVTPSGYSEYRVSDDGRRRIDVQANSVNVPNGTLLDIFANNIFVGRINIDAGGNGYVRYDTNDGQSVPSGISNANTALILNKFFFFAVCFIFFLLPK